jgi:hypothetical protein
MTPINDNILDVIFIEAAEFYRLLEESVQKGELSPHKTITTLLEKFDCFKEDGSHPNGFHKQVVRNMYHGTKFGSAIHHGGFTAPGYRNTMHHHQPPSRRNKSISYIDKVKRETVALLNKVSKTNFSVVMEKILRFCDDTTVPFLIEMTIEKCYMQDCYMELFVKILMRLRDLKDTYGMLVNDALRTFVETYSLNLKSDINELLAYDHTEYDAYCIFVSKKNRILKKNAVILYMSSQSIVDVDMAAYKQVICNLVDDSLQSVNTESMELGAQLMADYFKVFTPVRIDLEWLERSKEHPSCTNRVRFALLSIIENNNIK